MITTDKNAAVTEFDIVVRVGKFPTQGKKLVIQKGRTIISVSAEDCSAFLNALSDVCNFKTEYKTVPTFEPLTPINRDAYCNDCPAR